MGSFMARDSPRGRLSPGSDVSIVDDEIDVVGGGRVSRRSSPRLSVSPKQAVAGSFAPSKDSVQSAGCASASSEGGDAVLDARPQDNVLVTLRMDGVNRAKVEVPSCPPVSAPAAASPAEPPQKLAGAAPAAAPTPLTGPAEYYDLTRLTRKRAADALEPAIPHAAPRKPPPRLRQPTRRLYTIAFTWPEGASWLSAQGDRKRAPSWYADRVTEQIELRAADGVSSFLVHVHGAIALEAREVLRARWEGAFAKARSSCTGRGGEETIQLIACDKSMPPMWPAAMRVGPVPHPSKIHKTTGLARCDFFMMGGPLARDG